MSVDAKCNSLPVTFQRIYRDYGPGLEHPATPKRVETVLRSMTEAAGSTAPFKVRFRFADGRGVTVSPRMAR